MDDRHTLLDTIANAFVPIHRDGYKFVAGAAIATLFLLLWLRRKAIDAAGDTGLHG